jgi:chemotaxis response regulator CheB
VKLIAKHPGLYVVPAADSGFNGIKQLEEQKPDVILIDNSSLFTRRAAPTCLLQVALSHRLKIVVEKPQRNLPNSAARWPRAHDAPLLSSAMMQPNSRS